MLEYIATSFFVAFCTFLFVTKMDDVDDLLFHYDATHMFDLSYLKDSMAGAGRDGEVQCMLEL